MRPSRPLVTTVVFDLDDTLYDCHRQRVQAAHRYACRKLLQAGLSRAVRRRLSLPRLLRLRRHLFREEQNLDTLDRRLCARLGLRGRVLDRYARLGQGAYFSYPVRNLRLFPDTRPTLRRLHRRGVRIYVLTAGVLRIQRAKTHLLGLDRLPYIRRIFYTGLTRGRGKQKYLRQVLRTASRPERVMVVGDRPDSEIRAANELGMRTVLRRGGEFADYRPQNRWERPDFTIRRLSQLFRLPFRFGDD